MTDYMEQDAERLIQTLESCAVDPMSNGYAEVSKRLLVAAACSLRTLLAHIQRGVPEGDDGKRVLREVFALCEDTEAKCYEDPSDFNRGRSFEAKGIARAIGAWYQEEFCGRTHMGEPAAAAPAPADVPMPEPVAYAHGDALKWLAGSAKRSTQITLTGIQLDFNDTPINTADQMHTYGERCRAAGDAAGYARGIKEAALRGEVK